MTKYYTHFDICSNSTYKSFKGESKELIVTFVQQFRIFM
jgi:hypothetical protein